MNAVEMVKEICKQRDIPISRLERECGFSNGYIGKLKRGYFPIDKAEKIARYLDLNVNTLDEYKHDVASYKADIERFHKDMRKYANADKSALKQLVGMNLEDWYWTLTVAEKRTLWLGVIDKIWYGDDKQIRVDFLT